MRLHRLLASAAIAASVLALGGCDWTKIFSLGHKTGWEFPDDPNIALAPQVRAAEVVAPPADGRMMSAQDSTGVRTAYLRATPDAMDREKEHIFIDSGGHTWEIFGLPHAGKPLENLHWEGQLLVVERWRSATEGVRVFLDSGTGRGIRAEAITRDTPTSQP